MQFVDKIFFMQKKSCLSKNNLSVTVNGQSDQNVVSSSLLCEGYLCGVCLIFWQSQGQNTFKEGTKD